MQGTPNNVALGGRDRGDNAGPRSTSELTGDCLSVAIETQPRVSPALTPRKPLGNWSPRAGPRPERGVNTVRRKKEKLVIGFDLVYRRID